MDRITITEHAHRTGDFTQAVVCAMCGDPLPEPFGWCAGCRMAFCPPCGRMHFCHASCRANRCIAGLCVRLVIDGVLAERWGVPSDEVIAAMLDIEGAADAPSREGEGLM